MAVGHRGHEARISVGQATTTRQSTSAKSSLPAPMAPRRPHSFTVHGVSIVDDYAWLKDKNWQEVLRDPSVLNADIRGYLEAENNYTDSLLGHTAGLQKTLVAEMRGRIMNTSSSAARGIRRITGLRPGARTSRARNILRFACATGKPALTLTTSS